MRWCHTPSLFSGVLSRALPDSSVSSWKDARYGASQSHFPSRAIRPRDSFLHRLLLAVALRPGSYAKHGGYFWLREASGLSAVFQRQSKLGCFKATAFPRVRVSMMRQIRTHTHRRQSTVPVKIRFCTTTYSKLRVQINLLCRPWRHMRLSYATRAT